MNETSPHKAQQKIGRTVAALVQELEKLQSDLLALRQRVNAGAQRFAPDEWRKVELAAQWISIAIEVEQRFVTKSHSTGYGTARAIDLDAARDSIGSKLDRLRAAQRSDGVSEQPVG